MRNAAASFDDDLGYEAPPRRNAPRKARAPASGAKRKAKGQRKGPRVDMTKVARWAAVGMGATMAVGIVVNALMLQKGRHPAPLFGGTAATAAKPAAAIVPVPPPAVRTARAEMAAESEPPALPPPARPGKPAGKAGSADQGDAIGKLIAGGAPSTRSRAEPTRNAARSDDNAEAKTVTGVQRALTKLGFKVPATGSAGPATRKAIEAFEKAHHLPVTGEVDGRLVKVLAAESRTRID